MLNFGGVSVLTNQLTMEYHQEVFFARDSRWRCLLSFFAQRAFGYFRNPKLGGGSNISFFSTVPGEMKTFYEYVSNGLVQPPTSTDGQVWYFIPHPPKQKPRTRGPRSGPFSLLKK